MKKILNKHNIFETTNNNQIKLVQNKNALSTGKFVTKGTEPQRKSYL